MRVRALVTVGMVSAVMLGAGCSKSDPGETTPETAAGEVADTTTVGAEAARDSMITAEGAYRDSISAGAAAADSAAGALGDSAAAELPDTAGAAPTPY
jgi:hypothetical protein